MQEHQTTVAPDRSGDLDGPPTGARVIPLFRGRESSEQPLVTLGNGSLWKKVDVVRHLRVSARTVERWMKKEGLPYLKPFGPRGPVRFDPAKVQAWWAARCANGTGR